MTLSPQDRAALADRLVGDPRRLAALRTTQLLDTPPEEVFDAVSRLAAQLLGVPASFMSLVDADRDFYKSQAGFPEPVANARQMSGRTFCHFALASPEPLVIPDTHADPVWRAVPTVESLGVRAYLGVPLILEGQPIGSFCAIDDQPHAWTSLEIDTMVQLAQSIGRELKLDASLRAALLKADRANALARANEELLAVVAHDLRTPLQTVSLIASLLVRHADEKQLAHLHRLQRAASDMEGMVDNLLSLHGTGSGSAGLKALISTAKLLTDAQATMELVAERAGVKVELGHITDVPVLVDYAQFLRVLCNLIGNCVKYCPRGSTSVLAAAVAGEEVVLTVTDNGPGMSAEQHTRAFERGWQASPGSSPRKGVGLGLSIVRNLVEENGGQVSLGPAPGCGVNVTIKLPLAAS